MKQNLQDNDAITTQRNGEQVVRKRKKHRKKKKLPLGVKILSVVGIIILIMGIAGALFFAHGAFSVKNQTNDTSDLPAHETLEYNGEKYVLNEDIVTVLFIGHDDDAETSDGVKADEADAVMALAMDTVSGETTIIAIPRDTMCLVDQYSQGEFAGTIREQLCLAYGYGDTPEHASENVVKSVRTILCNIPIKYYYTLDEAVIAELNDAIGGVDLVPLQSIPKTNIVEGEETVLFGKAAHDYVQYRDTRDPNSSHDRLARETQYIKAFLDQAFDTPTGSVKRATDLLGIISEHSTTNISASELAYLTNTMAPGIVDGTKMITLEGSSTQNGRYIELELDENALYKTVIDTYYKKEKAS